jgi:microcystin-dependent protein
MTVAITHNFVSAKSDGVDNTLVQPSNWGTAATNTANSTHTLNMAGGGNVLGRTTAGTGVPTELAASTQGLSILGAADIPALIALGIPVFSTGDAKLTYKTTADPGWIMANEGTIGKAGSGASTRANADTQALFVLFYSNMADAQCPVSGGRTGNAVTDFNNGKTLRIPQVASRALVTAGSGSGLSAWGIGGIAGEENHILSAAEMPSHNHSASSASSSFSSDGGHTHVIVAGAGSGGGNVQASNFSGVNTNTQTGFASISTSTSTSTSIGFAGSGGAHNNIQPSSAINMMFKL